MNSAYSFFIGWVIIVFLFYGSLAFEGTRTITYYVLWLSIVLTLVVHSDTLQGLLEAAVPPAVQSDTSVQKSSQSVVVGPLPNTTMVPTTQFSVR